MHAESDATCAYNCLSYTLTRLLGRQKRRDAADGGRGRPAAHGIFSAVVAKRAKRWWAPPISHINQQEDDVTAHNGSSFRSDVA